MRRHPSLVKGLSLKTERKQRREAYGAIDPCRVIISVMRGKDFLEDDEEFFINPI